MLLGACLLLFGALPPHAALAGTKQSTIDNTLADFSDGTFQRSALGSLQNTAISPKDLPGAVRLGPIGLLKTWIDSPFNLKKRLINMGATGLGNRVFVIGGATPINSSTNQSVAEVWSAAVSQTDGVPAEDWQAEPPLNKVVGSNSPVFIDPSTQQPIPVAEVDSPGVTSVATPGGSGYIYVIGGHIKPTVSSAFDFSSYAVQIGIVGSNGRISSWVAGPPLPSPDPLNLFLQLGVQSPAVTSITIGGTTYVYVIGGLKRYRQGSGGQAQTISEGSKNVFYAQVGSGGQLFQPGTGTQGWTRLPDIPVPGNSPAGIWDAMAVADNFIGSNGAANVLYVVGGQLTPDNPSGNPPSLPSFSSVAYRATIGNDGALTWDTNWQGTLPQTRSGFNGVAFNGQLYAVGGLPSGGNQPDKGVLTSYVENNFTLHQFNGNEVPSGIEGNGSNFLKSDALPFPRVFHGTALVKSDGTTSTSAFVYVLGGRGNTSDGNTGDDQGSDTVFFGKIGSSEDVNETGYAPDAWYFSQPYEINYTGAQLQKIYWSDVIDRATADNDITVEYRISSANSCSNPGWSDADWQTIDAVESDGTHTSANGTNTSPAINLAARCFQYRAHLTTAFYTVTPSLLNVNIDIFVPGNPDLSTSKQPADVRGANNIFLGLNVFIKNVASPPPTLDTGFDTDNNGSFYIDLCIFGPNPAQGTVVAPPLPWSDTNHGCSKVFANVPRSVMKAGVTDYLIPNAAVLWKDTQTEQPVNLIKYFQQPGSYSVIVAVDSYNNVDEGANGGEDNNISGPYTFTVDKVGVEVRLPMVKR